MKTSTKRLVKTALLTALVCVVTMAVKIPSPFKGYLNLGDSMVLLSAFMLSPLDCFLAAGIGSAMADIFSGYAVYAPATFVIKGCTALVACLIAKKLLNGKVKSNLSVLVGGAVGELVMVAGYYLFEGAMYGFSASAVNILPNMLQGIAGLVLGTALCGLTKRIKINF